jgi:hypothetical protein
MTEPTHVDYKVNDDKSVSAIDKFIESQRSGYNVWAYASLDEVSRAFSYRDLLSENIFLLKAMFLRL